MSSIGSSKIPGTDIAFRRELSASVPADLDSVLAFYRSELGKLGWKETAERAVVKPDQAQLAFTSPDGPATLKLGRSNDETTRQSRAEDSGHGREGRHHAEARPGQADVQQSRRWRGHPHHQQADHQDRGGRGRAAIEGPDAGAAARANTAIR